MKPVLITLLAFTLCLAGCENKEMPKSQAKTKSKKTQPETEPSKKISLNIPEEMEGLDSTSAIDRENSLLHLAESRVAAKKAAPKAVELLKDDSAGVRAAALQLIFRAEHNTPEALAGISILASGDKDENVRNEALSGLKIFGAHEEHAKVCAKLLGSKEQQLREIGSLGLTEANHHAVVVQAELVSALKDKSAYVRANCAEALGNLGVDASDEARKGLEALKNDKEKMVQTAVKKALERLP